MRDYIITNPSGVYWPDLPAYRGPQSRIGTGYPTAEIAHARLRYILTTYAARHGAQGPDLRVVERVR